MALAPIFKPVEFDALPGWAETDFRTAFNAFRRSAERSLQKPYRTGSLGVDHLAFCDAFIDARQGGDLSNGQAKQFFETHFLPHRVSPGDGVKYSPEHRLHGFVTGFYEPEAEASARCTGRFRYPVYGRPGDLVDVDDANRPPGLDPYFAFARKTADGLAEYPDRGAIEQGALAGRGLELAWLSDAVELFFIHVQGAARLKFADGSTRRITYAAKTGHRFTGPGSILASMGEIARKDVTMQSIKAWFAANPDRISEILWQNRSFIFFRDAPVDEDGLGPVAAAKVPLTPGYSLAVDRLLHTFATPFHIHAPDLTVFDNKPFSRLMIAQDTGSAITGPARGDLFTGCGALPGEMAGVIKHAADFFALVPRQLVKAAP